MPLELRCSILVALALATGCSTTPQGMKVRWPPEPDAARIRFVKSITTGADVESSTWPGIQRSLLGTAPVAFRQPTSLALTPEGSRLYMTDQTLGQVVWFDFKLERAERFAPEMGLAQPFGIALDEAGNVYVSEPPARRVRVFSSAGQLLREFGGEAERPTGLAIDPKRQLVYVSDGSSVASQNHRVLVYSQQGKLLRTIGTRGSAPGQFNFPAHLTVDKDGNLFVVDSLNFRVQVFDPQGNLFRFFGEAGEGLGKFARPKGVATDKRGITYVVDTTAANVQMFDSSGQLLMAFGGAANLLEYFERPAPITVDLAGRFIYVGEQSPSLPRINVYEFLEVAESTPAKAAPLPGAPEAPPGR